MAGPTIVAKFIADTKQLTGEVNTMASGAESRLSGFAKKAAVILGGAFVVDKVVQFGKASVDAAMADAEAQASLAQTLKNVTGATDAQIKANEDYLSGLSKQTAIADDDLRPALDTLVRGFGNAEDAQKALALATDVSAGTGKDLSTVTEAMMKAAQGQTGALKRLGIETQNADGSAKSLDQIMADMATTFEGQAAVAADTTAGKMRNAQIQFGEFQEQIGTALMPVLGALASFFTETLVPALSTVASWVTDHKDVIAAAFIGFATVVGTVVVPAFIAWAAAAGAAALATLVAAAPFIAIGAVIAGVALLIIKNWDTIVAATKKAWQIVTGAVRAAFDWIKRNWPLLLAIITGPIGAAVLVVVRNWDTIKGAVMGVFNWIKSNWPTLLAILTGPIGAAVLLIVKNWKTIKDAATDLFNWVKGKFDAIAGAISGVVGTISGAIGSVVSAIKAPINALIGGWNRIEFKVPTITLPKVDLGPFGSIGGGSFGGYTFGFPDIPRLAGGGVLSAPTLVVAGEAGREIVTPEALMRRIVAEEAGAANYTLNLYPRTADASDVAYGFRRLELLAGVR